MSHKNVTTKIIACLVACLALTACHQGNSIPDAPNYADTAQWFVVDRGAGADLFYITSTETGDYMLNDELQHYADVSSDSVRILLLGEMQGVDHLLSGRLNFYSPYYRQCTMETFTSDSLVAERIPLAMSDVKRAFSYYMQHLNGGRPFVLAGFSQGAIGVVELLKTMDDEAYSRMAAAYVIGWKVVEEDLAENRHIRPAHDSTDLGVTVCYNSVRCPGCAIPMLSDGNRVAINPVNWHIDGEPATLVYRNDTLIVALDTTSMLLLVDGYTRNDYMLPLIGREGNYHCLEISLYAPSLSRNMAIRAKKMIEQKQ